MSFGWLLTCKGSTKEQATWLKEELESFIKNGEETEVEEEES